MLHVSVVTVHLLMSAVSPAIKLPPYPTCDPFYHGYPCYLPQPLYAIYEVVVGIIRSGPKF